MSLPRRGALFGRELAHVFAELGENAFAPQHFDAHRFQFFGGGGGTAMRASALSIKILHCRFASGRGQNRPAAPIQLPAQMIDVKQQQRLRDIRP